MLVTHAIRLTARCENVSWPLFENAERRGAAWHGHRSVAHPLCQRRNRIRSPVFPNLQKLTEFIWDDVGVGFHGLLRILQRILLRRQFAEFRRFFVSRFRHSFATYAHYHHKNDEDQRDQSSDHHTDQRRQHDPSVLSLNRGVNRR